MPTTLVCTNAPGPKTETKTDAWLNVLSVNLGNLDEVVDKTCGVAPYQGGLCSIAQEEIVAANLARLRPDIAFLTELVDSGRCEPDSWEGDSMNWTPGLDETFRENRGYDPLPWLVVLAGYTVESREASNAFLADFRKTIGERFSSHYETMAELAGTYSCRRPAPSRHSPRQLA